MRRQVRHFFIIFFFISEVFIFFMKLFSQYLVSSITLGHHHLTELIKVHGSRTILIQFFNDSLQFLISERSKQLSNQSSQSLGGDEALTLLVVDPECVLQLLLHGLNVGVLHQEGGAELSKLRKLNLTRTILINLIDQVHQLLL